MCQKARETSRNARGRLLNVTTDGASAGIHPRLSNRAAFVDHQFSHMSRVFSGHSTKLDRAVLDLQVFTVGGLGNMASFVAYALVEFRHNGWRKADGLAIGPTPQTLLNTRRLARAAHGRGHVRIYRDLIHYEHRISEQFGADG